MYSYALGSLYACEMAIFVKMLNLILPCELNALHALFVLKLLRLAYIVLGNHALFI
jgi:hypothetical protein